MIMARGHQDCVEESIGKATEESNTCNELETIWFNMTSVMLHSLI